MQLSDLAKVLCAVDGSRLVPENNIIAAGPLHHQPATPPFRLVIRFMPGKSPTGWQFVVHEQQWLEHYQMDDGTLHPDMTRSGYIEGDYFEGTPEGFKAALVKFAQRLSQRAGEATTIFRGIKLE